MSKTVILSIKGSSVSLRLPSCETSPALKPTKGIYDMDTEVARPGREEEVSR